MATQPPTDTALSWEIGIPLATNPRMLKTLAIVCALAALIPSLLLGVILASQGDWDSILPLIGIFGLVGLGLFGAFLLIMRVFFGNRLRTRYTLDERGILQETLDRASKTANRLAVVAGALGGGPGTAGAGLMAMSREAERLEWRGGFTLEARPRRHLLIFRNAWRPVLEVYCTPETFDQAQTLARRHMEKWGTARRVATRSPLPTYLSHTALILAACFPILGVHEEFGLDILVPLILLAFALATLWLIPLFGYVVLVSNALILLAFAGALLEERTSHIRPNETYLHYEVFSSADWASLGLATLALVYLSWFALRAIRGKFMSLLMKDHTDMGA